MSIENVKEAFYKTTFTLKGRVFHPNLVEPRTKTNMTTGKTREVFDCMFAWDPTDPANGPAYKALIDFMTQMQGSLFPGVDPRALVNPIKASHVPGWPEYQRNDYKPNAEYLRGHHWINAETGKDMPPTVVNAQRQPVISEAEIYSGRNAVVNFQLYPMLMDPTNRQKKIGFGVNLNAVMVLDGGDREGGRSQVDVNQVFGGFAQDMGMTPAFGQFGQAPAQAPMQGFPAQQPMPQAPAQQPMQGFPGQAPAFPGQAPAQAPMQGFPGQQPAQGGFPGYEQQQQQTQTTPAFPGNFNPNGFGR